MIDIIEYHKMKLIFRYALLANFTEKDQVVTKDQLIQAIKNGKNQSLLKDLDNRISTCS